MSNKGEKSSFLGGLLSLMRFQGLKTKDVFHMLFLFLFLMRKEQRLGQKTFILLNELKNSLEALARNKG